jgi:hypothetical protein
LEDFFRRWVKQNSGSGEGILGRWTAWLEISSNLAPSRSASVSGFNTPAIPDRNCQ